MANFNLVVNTSNFKPFTYEEMVKPLLLYKQEEDARQQAYLDLQEKVSTLEDLAASEKDAEAYGAYTAYKNRLKEAVDAMAKNGLTRQNNQVFNLRRSYINDIKPLNDLLEKRNKLVEEQRANDKDGTNIYSIDYGNMSLAEMKRNPTQTYNTLNGNIIRAMSAETFVPLANQILKSPEYDNVMGKQYFQERIQRGYTLDQIINELKDTEASSKLAQLKQNILSSLGMDKKGFSKAKQDRVEQFINMGAMAALGKTEYNTLNDKSYLNALELAQKKHTDAGTANIYQQIEQSRELFPLELSSKRAQIESIKANTAATKQATQQSNAEFKYQYITDTKGDIIGVREQKPAVKKESPMFVGANGKPYQIINQGGVKVVVRINEDGTQQIVNANTKEAKSVRRKITGDEDIYFKKQKNDDWEDAWDDSYSSTESDTNTKEDHPAFH